MFCEGGRRGTRGSGPSQLVFAGVVGYFPRMDKADAIARLRAHESELRAMGVTGLSLFGSVARGEAGPGSDVDVVARLDDVRVRTLLDQARVTDRVGALLGTKVDLISENGLKPRFRERIAPELVHVF